MAGHEQRECVREAPQDERGHPGGEVVDADPHVAGSHAVPEMQYWSHSGTFVPNASTSSCTGPRTRPAGARTSTGTLDRVAGHQVRDAPVDGRADEEGQHVGDHFPGQVAPHWHVSRGAGRRRGPDAALRSGTKAGRRPGPARVDGFRVAGLGRRQVGQRVDGGHRADVTAPHDRDVLVGRCRWRVVGPVLGVALEPGAVVPDRDLRQLLEEVLLQLAVDRLQLGRVG